MPKKTKDELYYWLWFEALRLSNDYKKICEWVENSSEPAEKLDWSQYPHVKETYLHMEDVFSRPEDVFSQQRKPLDFDAWWQQRKPLDDVVGDIYSRMQVRPLNLSEIISKGLNLFKDELVKDFDSAKDELLAWTKEQYQQPEDLTIIIDTGLIENAKEVATDIKKLIVRHRGENKPNKRFTPKEIGLYLNLYREKKGLKPITNKEWPAKAEGNLEDSDRLRMIRKARRIIDNAAKGKFLGEY